MMIDRNTALLEPSFAGYLILKTFDKNKTDKLSVYELMDKIRRHGITTSRQLIIGLVFLFSVDLIMIDEVYVCLKK
ncbi:MAG: hypothetical protein M0Q94_11515 [Candidatus Cloacimonetes bacterium]|nr:hypothetical protein [Candidatus Cloacimonadota bacterium]